MPVDRYYRNTDPRDEEWWRRPLERTCACCGAVFILRDDRLERLPHVFCPSCIKQVVDAAIETADE